MTSISLRTMAISAAMTLLAGMANAESVLQPVQVGDVTYITGGVGSEERAELEAAKKDYNLHIMNAGSGVELAGGSQVIIHDAKGAEVLNVQSEPLLYVRLPAGTYQVEGINEGDSKKQKVTVSAKQSAHIFFGWSR
ncbi:MAG: hypothetical protein J0L97_08865 [Alphaproteobacteria bacterium]|nr:hypothetical protein [Alphaproteobacteria bacterium]